MEIVFVEAGAAFEEGKLDEDSNADDVAIEGFDEVTAGFHGAAGGEEVIDDGAFFTFFDGVLMDFQRVLSVFKVVGEGDFLRGEFAGLANGNKAARKRLGDSRAENEAAGFGSDDCLNALAAKRIAEDFDGEREGGRIG